MKIWDVSPEENGVSFAEHWYRVREEPYSWEEEECEVQIVEFENLRADLQLDIGIVLMCFQQRVYMEKRKYTFYAKLIDPKPLLWLIAHTTTIDIRWPEILVLEYNGKQFTRWEDLCKEIDYHPKNEDQPK